MTGRWADPCCAHDTTKPSSPTLKHNYHYKVSQVYSRPIESIDMWTRLLKYSTGRRPTLLRATWNHPYCPQPAHQTGAWHHCGVSALHQTGAWHHCGVFYWPATHPLASHMEPPLLPPAGTSNRCLAPKPMPQTGAWHHCGVPALHQTGAGWHHCGVPALCRVPGTQTGTGASPKPVPGKPVPGTCQRVAAQRWPARCWAADAKRVPGTIAARARCAGCLAPVVGTSCPSCPVVVAPVMAVVPVVETAGGRVNFVVLALLPFSADKRRLAAMNGDC